MSVDGDAASQGRGGARVYATVGHSNRTTEEFLDVLREAGVGGVADVRRLPGSRAQPQFDEEALASALEREGIAYRWFRGLTGRRPVSTEVPFERNAWWQNRSFHNYADHALSAEFADALDDLRAWSLPHPVAIMCSEAVWWRCHRRIIADHLLARGETVRHLLGPGRVEDARLSAGAVTEVGGVVVYPGEPGVPGE